MSRRSVPRSSSAWCIATLPSCGSAAKVETEMSTKARTSCDFFIMIDKRTISLLCGNRTAANSSRRIFRLRRDDAVESRRADGADVVCTIVTEDAHHHHPGRQPSVFCSRPRPHMVARGAGVLRWILRWKKRLVDLRSIAGGSAPTTRRGDGSRDAGSDMSAIPGRAETRKSGIRFKRKTTARCELRRS